MNPLEYFVDGENLSQSSSRKQQLGVFHVLLFPIEIKNWKGFNEVFILQQYRHQIKWLKVIQHCSVLILSVHIPLVQFNDMYISVCNFLQS